MVEIFLTKLALKWTLPFQENRELLKMLLIFFTKRLSTLFSNSCLYGAEVSVLDSQPVGTYHKGRVLILHRIRWILAAW